MTESDFIQMLADWNYGSKTVGEFYPWHMLSPVFESLNYLLWYMIKQTGTTNFL